LPEVTVSLHGTLETFALPDVMALLAATKKTGELRVVGGRIDGRVYLDAGQVVAAQVGRADSFVDAVFELLRLTSGKFSFDAEKAPAEAAEPVDIEPLLLEAGSRLTEWRGIETVIPSMDHGVKLVVELGDPHVTLAADQWRMVVAVAGARCVHEVADRLGLGEYGACKSLKDLVESGVVEVTDPPKPEAKAAPKAKAEAETAPASAPKPEPEPEPEPKSAPKPVAAADPEPADEPEAAEPAATAEPETKPEPAPAQAAAKGKPVIEPERKPPAPGGVDVPVLKTKDPTSPIPPGEEPGAAKPPAVKKPAVTTGAVSTSEAKQLVSQLAALGTEKAAEGPAKPKAKADKPDDSTAAAEGDQAEKAQAAPAAEGGDAEEPLNRGLLLKFLSSVRQ
jgi:hypothetical protein